MSLSTHAPIVTRTWHAHVACAKCSAPSHSINLVGKKRISLLWNVGIGYAKQKNNDDALVYMQCAIDMHRKVFAPERGMPHSEYTHLRKYTEVLKKIARMTGEGLPMIRTRACTHVCARKGGKGKGN